MSRLFLVLFFVFVCVSSSHAAVPGDSCSVNGAHITSGGPTESGVIHVMTCNGTNWVSLVERGADGRSNLQIDNDTGSCTSAKTGRLRYNDGTDVWEYCDGSAWGPFEQAGATGGGSGLCVAPAFCPNVGDVCDDNNAGTTNDPIFAGYMFYGKNCEALFVSDDIQSTSSQWKITADGPDLTAFSYLDGHINSLQIPNSTNYPAFKICKDLTDGGYSDWYLPSRGELDLLYNNANLINNNSNNDFVENQHWSSTEAISNQTRALRIHFGTSFISQSTKTGNSNVRCVRRELGCLETPGGVCSNGEIFAGGSADNGSAMFTTRCDAHQYWDGDSCEDLTNHWTGSGSSATTDYVTTNRDTIAWNENAVSTAIVGAQSMTKGEDNTAAIVALSDNTVPYGAAEYCDNLVAHGYSDWYLPAIEELNILYLNQDEIGNFTDDQFYSSSTENDDGSFRSFSKRFNIGGFSQGSRGARRLVRCVRK